MALHLQEPRPGRRPPEGNPFNSVDSSPPPYLERDGVPLAGGPVERRPLEGHPQVFQVEEIPTVAASVGVLDTPLTIVVSYPRICEFAEGEVRSHHATVLGLPEGDLRLARRCVVSSHREKRPDTDFPRPEGRPLPPTPRRRRFLG